MAKWFTYGEFIKSATADKLGIDNTPTDETIQDNIIELMRVLDGVREEWSIKCKKEYEMIKDIYNLEGILGVSLVSHQNEHGFW